MSTVMNVNKNIKKTSKVIAIDFDGTLAELYKPGNPYQPKTKIKEKPILDVITYCNALHKKGVKIIIHSSRHWSDYSVIRNWLDKNNVFYDDIILGKFKADAFIDDLNVNPVLDKDWKIKLSSLLK